MPPKCTAEKEVKFKSRHVDRYAIKKHQLPDNLKKLWSEESYREFVKEAREEICGRYLRGSDDFLQVLESLLAIVPKLAESDDTEVHVRVEQFYEDCCAFELVSESSESRQNSIKEYVTEALFTGRRKYLPSGWAEEVHPYSDHKTISQVLKECEADELTRIKNNMQLNMILFKEGVYTGYTLKVEEELVRECRETPVPPEGSVLLKIATESVRKVQKSNHWFKLDSKFLKDQPGVYFLYYVGKKKLYGEVNGIQYFPIYIGMSTTDISGRLADHKGKIEQAKDLNITDFAVNFMFVDNKHYAPCIEGMLIEHYKPLWNKETIGFCFGVGDNSMWKKVHIDEDEKSINEICHWLTTLSSSESESDIFEFEVDSDSICNLESESEGYSYNFGSESSNDDIYQE